MVLKFCFNNEIHRCSEPPSSYEALRAFLNNTFKSELPDTIKLHYLHPESQSEVPLDSQEAYDHLRQTYPSKAIKVFIINANPSAPLQDSAYDIIQNPEHADNKIVEVQEGKVKIDEPKLELLVKDLSESILVPQIKEINLAGLDEEQMRKLIKDVLLEEVPYIVSKVKDSVLTEVRPLLSAQREAAQAQQEEIKVDAVDFDQQVEIIEGNEKIEEERRGPVFFEKLKEFGQKIKNRVSEIPEKAKHAWDDLSHKIEGDAYVEIEEGRYPKSVVEKAKILKEFFAEESMKDLLEFVKKYPRNIQMEYLAHLFLVKDEPQPQEQQEVDNQEAELNNDQKANEIPVHEDKQ